MEKIDFRKSLKHLYQPSAKEFALVEVPAMAFVKIDGSGDPNVVEAYKQAIEWLYGVSYAIKFAIKAEGAMDYVVPPLEGLWWAKDMNSFTEARDKSAWSWTMMIMAPDLATQAHFEAARDKTGKKLGAPPESLRLETHDEGLCVQIMHLGSYDDEGPVLARLHKSFLPENGLVERGRHHEIYLSDARKTAPEKLKTVLRQPVSRR